MEKIQVKLKDKQKNNNNINAVCLHCKNDCKQSYNCKIIQCKKFEQIGK